MTHTGSGFWNLLSKMTWYKEDIKMKKEKSSDKACCSNNTTTPQQCLKDVFTGQDAHFNKDVSLEENKRAPKTWLQSSLMALTRGTRM